jgi:hypothetical protein
LHRPHEVIQIDLMQRAAPASLACSGAVLAQEMR